MDREQAERRDVTQVRYSREKTVSTGGKQLEKSSNKSGLLKPRVPRPAAIPRREQTAKAKKGKEGWRENGSRAIGQAWHSYRKPTIRKKRASPRLILFTPGAGRPAAIGAYVITLIACQLSRKGISKLEAHGIP